MASSLIDKKHFVSNLAETQRINDYELRMKQLHLFETGSHYNCTFAVGPEGKPKKIFKCHRLIIAISSTVLETMLLGAFMEAKTSIDDPIIITDTTPEAFEASMRFIYGSCIRDLLQNIQLTLLVLEFAHKWGIGRLEKAAAQMCFTFQLNASEMLGLRYYFFRGQLTDELDRVEEEICDGACAILKDFKHFDRETVEGILKLSVLNIFSEKQVYDALVEWGELQIREHKMTGSTIRAVILDLLKYVRFNTFTVSDFAELSDDDRNVLTKSEILDLFTCTRLEKHLPGYMSDIFDFSYIFRGMFVLNSNFVIRVSTLITYALSSPQNINGEFALGNILTVEADAYLLSVGLFSMEFCNFDHMKRSILISLRENGQAKFSRTEYSSGDEHKLSKNKGPPRIKLEKPFLLSREKEYVITVVDATRKGPLPALGIMAIRNGINVATLKGRTDISSLELALKA